MYVALNHAPTRQCIKPVLLCTGCLHRRQYLPARLAFPNHRRPYQPAQQTDKCGPRSARTRRHQSLHTSLGHQLLATLCMAEGQPARTPDIRRVCRTRRGPSAAQARSQRPRRVPALPAAQAQQRQPQAQRLRLDARVQRRTPQWPAPDRQHSEVAALPPLARAPRSALGLSAAAAARCVCAGLLPCQHTTKRSAHMHPQTIKARPERCAVAVEAMPHALPAHRAAPPWPG